MQADGSTTGAPSDQQVLAHLVAELRAHLTWADDAGLRSLGAAAESLAASANAQASPAAQPTPPSPPEVAMPRMPAARATPAPIARAGKTAPAPVSTYIAGIAGALEKSGLALPTLESVREELGECTRCKLHKSRNKIVFGDGSQTARLVFVGEAPGEDEDLQGIPFVGKAGQLLTKMIEAMGLKREEVYICNTVKCRPPNNRNPEPDELGPCEPFLKGQLAALKAEVIVTLGKFAAQSLLRDETPISRLRGSWREYSGVALMPTFHPAYLLRSPGEKGKVWADLQQVMAKLNLPGKSA